MTQACDGCGATGVALRKVSLGHDFFGAGYDRLTPASDKAPAWYCPGCSERKRMQLDVRAIRDACRRLAEGKPSPLSERAALARARARVADIGAALAEAGEAPPLLNRGEVTELAASLEQIAAG